jgi:hypothetical protein
MTRNTSIVACSLVLLVAGGCAGPRGEGTAAQAEPRRERPPPSPRPPPLTPEPAPISHEARPDPATGLREVFPHVRVDVPAGLVEIDGEVPIDAHNPRTPRVYLEAIVCARDTKEHESLVVTDARASHVHAALLLLGIEPGKPGTWDWEGERVRAIPPEGPRVEVRLRTASGAADARAWVRSLRDGRLLAESDAASAFLFAGSQMVRTRSGEQYRADREGCIVGLTTFGGEVIAWERMHSPEASIAEPIFVADAAMPPAGTAVVVEVRVRK